MHVAAVYVQTFLWFIFPIIFCQFAARRINKRFKVFEPSNPCTNKHYNSFFLAPEIQVNLSNTRPIQEVTFSKIDDLRWLLWHKSSHANTIFQKFAHIPNTDFFSAIVSRTIILGGDPFPFHEEPYDDPMNSDLWEARTNEFDGYLHEYFEQILEIYGEDIWEVFQELNYLSNKLEHSDKASGDIVNGGVRIKLDGELKKLLEIPAKFDVHADFVKQISSDFEFPLHWYKNHENFFLTGTTAKFESEEDLRKGLTSTQFQHYGSLSMNKQYESSADEKHWLLDSLNQIIRQSVGPLLNLRLNPSVYIIPKTQFYTTSHHIDTHVGPHITLYQHAEGSSVFYFLPILYGSFASFIAYHTEWDFDERIEFLLQFYSILNENNIGTIGRIVPGELLLVTPYTSHLVQAFSKEPTIVRAVELFLVPSAEDVSNVDE